MRKQRAIARGSRKRRSRILLISATILCVLVGYVVYAIQLPEERVFENIDQVVQQKALLQYGGDGPQPSSQLADNTINPITSTFERATPAWRAPAEDFYNVAQKDAYQLQLSSLTGLMDMVSADLREIQERFHDVQINEQGWADTQGLSAISTIADQTYAFASTPVQAGPLLKGTAWGQNDCIEWNVEYAGNISRSISIGALSADAFCLQTIMYEGAYQGIILMKFSSDGTFTCLRKSIDTTQVANMGDIISIGWDAYAEDMVPVFSIASGKVLVGDSVFE